jgi:predicted outer membrane repeat protein
MQTVTRTQNTTLLFLPGNHTLTSSLTIKNLSSFVMIASKHLPRPVINCKQQAMFRLISITHVRIDGLSLNGCLNNISMVDEFIMEDSIMLGNRNASRRALFVTDSSIIVVESHFESFSEAIYLLQSSSRISRCTFSNNTALTKGGALALRIAERCNITIEHSTFSFHTCYTEHSCEGAVLYSTHSELLIIKCAFDNNRDGAVAVFRSNVRIVNSCFSGNVAWRGSAIQILPGSFALISDSHFCYNEVDYDYYILKIYTSAFPGGAVNCRSCKVEITRSIFEYNKGVALLGCRTQIRISSCQFSYNTAAILGGGIHATVRTNVEILSIAGTISIVNNTANLGAVGIVHSIAVIKANVIFSGNIGSFFVYGGEVNIVPFHSEKTNFICTGNYRSNNTGNDKNYVGSEFIREGGAITLFASRLELQVTTMHIESQFCRQWWRNYSNHKHNYV